MMTLEQREADILALMNRVFWQAGIKRSTQKRQALIEAARKDVAAILAQLEKREPYRSVEAQLLMLIGHLGAKLGLKPDFIHKAAAAHAQIAQIIVS